MGTRREGGCACGAVRYQVVGRAANSMVCHCKSCRAVSAAPVLAWVTFSVENFEWLRGEPPKFHSSDAVTRRFCGKCGTPLSYQHRDSPDEIDLTTCSLDEPNAFPPTHHSWLGHDLGWVKFGDGLPSFQQSRFS